MSAVLERTTDRWPQRLTDWFEFPELTRWADRMGRGDGFIKIEESITDHTLTVRAELPGIDPDKDVDITVGNGLLTIAAERRDESTSEAAGRTMSEFHYGSYRRTLAVPKDIAVSDIKASYADGILTVSVPVPAAATTAVAKVPVKRG